MVATFGIRMVPHVEREREGEKGRERETGRYRFLMKSVFVPHSARWARTSTLPMSPSIKNLICAVCSSKGYFTGIREAYVLSINHCVPYVLQLCSNFSVLSSYLKNVKLIISQNFFSHFYNSALEDLRHIYLLSRFVIFLFIRTSISWNCKRYFFYYTFILAFFSNFCNNSIVDIWLIGIF